MIPQKKDIREMQLAFIGKLMAGLSHEFKNHLAIIREINGLVEDLLLLEESGNLKNTEILKKNFTVIDERVSQAAEMCSYLSKFSHRMDESISTFDIKEILEEEIYLLRRFAWQKQVQISFSSEEQLPAISNNASLLQFAIYCIIGPALESLEKDGKILFSVTRSENGVAITVDIKGKRKEPDESISCQAMLPEILKFLNAEHTYSTGETGNEKFIVTVNSIKNIDASGT